MTLQDAIENQPHAASDFIHLLARIDVSVEQPQQKVGRPDARWGSARRHVLEAMQDGFVEFVDPHGSSSRLAPSSAADAFARQAYPTPRASVASVVRKFTLIRKLSPEISPFCGVCALSAAHKS
jgi:hypothetical protein